METEATYKFPKIEWEKGELINAYSDMKEFSATGIDEDNKKYWGT